MYGSTFIVRKVYLYFLRSVGGIAAERGEHQDVTLQKEIQMMTYIVDKTLNIFIYISFIPFLICSSLHSFKLHLYPTGERVSLITCASC